jgi:hypothetical protein
MIQVGMTLADVESVLGCAPGDYSLLANGCIPVDLQFFAKEQQDRQERYQEWGADTPSPRYEDGNGPNRQDALGIRVWFDANGKVIDKCRMSYGYTAPSIATQIKRWFVRAWPTGRGDE